MRMISIRQAFASITTGLIALLTATTPTAQAAPTHPTTVLADVCATGFRGQPAYDTHCLTHGTLGNAARTWYFDGHTLRPTTQRRTICTQARRLHSLATAVHETYGDVYYDTYRNNRQVERWTVSVARTDCRALGIKL